ncbi:Exocyst subunit Exo70 family protein [Quillaja saponaria]|uniref:Exocyst subunit Exo70 family protein n=1 Tax=Quillaja saponaria TaxID=32244 RepID=A0AAD7PYZ1_QUISA|nr:Exocyst subunit Exo70 family protein [Quillaja saponaria]
MGTKNLSEKSGKDDEKNNAGETLRSPLQDPKEVDDKKPADDTEPAANTEGEPDDKKMEQEISAEVEPDSPPLCLEKALEDVDQFLLKPQHNAEENEDASLEIPKFMEKFLDLVEEKIKKYDTGEDKPKWSGVPEEDTALLVSVGRISKLLKLLTDQSKSSSSSSSEENNQGKDSLVNRISVIQQRAMTYLEEEFRLLLEDSRISNNSDPVVHDSKGKQIEQDHSAQPDSELAGSEMDKFPGYSDDVVLNLNKIAKEMISGGYETECCQIYIILRRNAFEESLQKLGLEKISMDEVQKMHWETLERDIATWISTFKQSEPLFSSERKLAESVFADYPSLSMSLFSNLARGVAIQLLNFAEGVAMTKRSAEKLFKFLDMYETLHDIIPRMDELFPEECANELRTETNLVKSRLGESAICIFCDLENSIKSDTGKTPVPGGAVHPLTRYTMNYLKYACEYKDTLEQVFKTHSKIERADSTSRPHDEGESYNADSSNNNRDENQSPFSAQLTRVMELLDSNLEGKAKVYKDVALSSIFMMNNGRYILQKIKGSPEIHSLMGDTWNRKRSSDLRQYHTNYKRETWNKLLGCLSHEGLTHGGKVVKPVLKERFKNFNTMFEEIHKTQSTWVVSDEQLQSELRVSISAVVIPAYRAFMGRFSQYLDPGRQSEKYIKFQPEDIETYVDELFDGTPATSMARRKT